MNQDRVVEHQPADSCELASDQPKAMDSPDLCVHSGDNANIVEILSQLYICCAVRTQVAKDYESSTDFYAFCTM